MEYMSNLIEQLKEAGVQYGYTKSKRHPSASEYLIQTKTRTDIFDLEKTAKLLEAAVDYMHSILKGGGKILFIGGKPEVRNIVKQKAQSLNQPYVAGRWIGGTLTNFDEIKKRIVKMQELEQKLSAGELDHYTKKERLQFEREVNRLKSMFEGLSEMQELPKALFIVDPLYEKTALKEALDMQINTIAIANTDNDFTKITFPIPANDTAYKAVSFLMDYIENSLKEK